MSTSLRSARRKRYKEDLRGRLVVARVPRPVKIAFYEQCRALGWEPCAKLREMVIKFSGVKA